MSNKKIAVVLIRGLVNVAHDVKKTLELMRLKKKHSCVVLDNNQVTKGMLMKVKDYVTYGFVDEETFVSMLDNRGELYGGKKLSENKVDSKKIAKEFFEDKIKLREFELRGLKPFFRLHPPKGGFERAGIKQPFAKGGVLGDRGDEIGKLISKML